VLLLARIAALLLGTALAIRSGSRGQFLYAMAIAMAFYPLAAPVRNPRVLVATVLGIAIIAIAASQLMDLLLDDPFEAKRFTFEEMAYGKSSASGRVTNVITLYKEWLSKPTAPIVGLGYGAFAYFSESAGEPYSHVLFADAVFELGLPGAAFMIVFVWTSTGAAIAVIRSSKDAPAQRAIAAMLVAWYTYELLLVNKQGALWGVASFFPAGVVMARLMTRDQAEEPDGHPSGELEFGAVECQHDSAVLETHGPSRG
jgi:O-antigen ligase